MKLLTGLALSAALLAGCTDKSNEVVVGTAAEPAAVQPSTPTWSFVEYMWCDKGADFSPESYAKLTASWNAINDADPTPAAGAFTIFPKVENELYDGMWATLWASEADRDAGWEEWNENCGMLGSSKRLLIFALSKRVKRLKMAPQRRRALQIGFLSSVH